MGQVNIKADPETSKDRAGGVCGTNQHQQCTDSFVVGSKLQVIIRPHHFMPGETEAQQEEAMDFSGPSCLVSVGQDSLDIDVEVTHLFQN